jgi:hypothetical protein
MDKFVPSELVVKADASLERAIAAEITPEKEKNVSPEELEKLIKKYHEASNK